MSSKLSKKGKSKKTSSRKSKKNKNKSVNNKIIIYKNPYKLNTKLNLLVDNDKLDKTIAYLLENKIEFFYDNTNLLEKLYSFRQPIHFSLIKYVPSSSKISSKKSKGRNQKGKKINLDIKNLNKMKKTKLYHYEQLNSIQNLSIVVYKIKVVLLENFPNKQLPKSIKQVSEEYARGVAKYALINYKLPNKTSNAYMKLWELYSLVPQLVSRKKQLNVFHLAEAPGQWINCTRHFIETKRPQVHHYNWLANSLNPTNPTNIKKYGKGIFGDNYGFIAKYPQKWLFGEDDTGDITKSENVRWFSDYMRSFVTKGGQPIHLVTGDAGIASPNINYVDLQKLEFGQMCMVVATSSIGSNCVIKHFLHYLNMYPQSYKGSGYMVSFIYIYYLMFEEVRLIKPHTSSPNSREFYLVGLRFRGITDDVFNKMMKILDTFEENNCFFKKEDIPASFSNQVIQFMTDLFNQNNEHYEIQNMLLTCMNNSDPAIKEATQCHKYLDSKFIREIQSKRYKEWIKKYKFE